MSLKQFRQAQELSVAYCELKIFFYLILVLTKEKARIVARMN